MRPRIKNQKPERSLEVLQHLLQQKLAEEQKLTDAITDNRRSITTTKHKKSVGDYKAELVSVTAERIRLQAEVDKLLPPAAPEAE